MESLPRGLVSTSGKLSMELDGIDPVDIGDIVQLWRAYNTNPSVHEGDTGYRLQNFFWRIWSNKCLSSSLSGSTLARLFLQISDPSPVNPTKESEPPSPNLKHEKHPPAHPGSGSTSKPPLPPILKKSNSIPHTETQKTTRLLLTDIGGRSVTRKPSNPPTPIPPSQPVVGRDTSTRQSHKKPFVVASKSKSAKRRPVLMRRKSSQQSSACSTRAHSPNSVPSPPVSRALEFPSALLTRTVQENEEASVEGPAGGPTDKPNPPDTITQVPDLDPDSQKEIPPAFLAELKELFSRSTPLPPLRPRLTPPVVGFFSTTACRRFDVRYLSAENYEQPSRSLLVDKDFRARFEEQKRWFEQYQMSCSLENPVLSGPGPFGVETAATTTGTDETVSPSRLGDSQGAASTVATSLQVSNGPPGTFSPGDPPGAPGNPFFLHTPPFFSLPRGPSQLSLLIEQSRSHRATPNSGTSNE